MKKVDLIIFNLLKIYIHDYIDSELLTLDDLKDIETFTDPKAKQQRIISTYLKRKYIGQWTIGEHGKPLSDKCYFSISHCGHYVLLAISKDCPVGVDIEKIKPVKKELIDFVCSDKEKELIKRDEDFFKIWTSKEALSKCVGIGLATKIKEIPSLPFDGQKSYGCFTYYSKQIQLENYIASVVLKSDKDFEINLIKEN